MFSHARSQSMPTMPARFGGQPQPNAPAPPAAGAGAAPGASPAAPTPAAGFPGAYYSAPPTPSSIVYVDPQQAAYYQQAAAAVAGAYPLAGADWSSQQQMFQQAAAQQQQQQQQMMAAGATVVPTYDWSALYAAAYPPKESDAAGTSEQQVAQAQAQAQAQQAYSDYYNYLNQEAYKAMAIPPLQTQSSQPGAVLQTPPPPFALDLSQPGALELYNQQMQQAYAAQSQASPVAGLTPPGAVGAFYPAVYSPEYLQQMAVLSSTMPAVSAPAATYPASAPTTPLVGPTTPLVSSMPAVGWMPALTSPSRAHGPKGFGSTGHGAEPGPRERREQREAGSVDKDPLTYRTEVCRTHLTTGHCDYGTNCQFAHGVMELRSREFDSKYKTELCKNYYLFGSQSCFFASRCKFIHDEYRLRASEFEFWLVSPSENLVRVEIVDPRNIQRLEQLTTLVNNPPKPPVSPLKPTERTLFHQQLEEEKARADTLIAAAAEQIAPFAANAATDAEIPLPEDTEPVAELPAERQKDERDDKDPASGLLSVHGDEPEPGSRPGHNLFSPSHIGGNNRAHVSPVSLRLNHSPSLSPVSCPKSPVARVRLEEMLPLSTVPPLVAASVAPGLRSPQRSPSHHSLVEHRRARLMELARPIEPPFGQKEEEGKQQAAGEQTQQEQIEGGAAAQPSVVADPSRMPLLDLASAAPSLEAAPAPHAEDKPTETAASAGPSTAPASSSARVPSSLSSSSTSTSSFERESAQDVRVRGESGGASLVFPRAQQRRRGGGGGGGWRGDQPQSHPYGFNHLPAGVGALPMGMTAAPAAPHPSSLFLGAGLDPSTGAMHQATLSFPIMSNAPISFQQAQQQQYRMQHRRGGGGGGGGRAPMPHPQQPPHRMQFGGAGGHLSPMAFNNDVRALTGIVPIDSIPSPVQRVSHPPPESSSGRIVTRSLSSPSSSPSSTAAQYTSSPSISASSSVAAASPNQSSPKPLWLEQQSRAMHLPVFLPLEEQAQPPQAEGEAQSEGEQQQQQQNTPPPNPSKDDGEQATQPAAGFPD